MEIHNIRKHRMMQIHDQENEVKGKTNLLPTKRQGLLIRGALGELNSNNVNAQREFNVGKVAVAAAEHEKKATLTRPLRSNYSHVQSKIDTGLNTKSIQPSSRPPLRREESTANLAARAAARSKVYGVMTDSNPKQNNIKESINIVAQAKKEKKKAKLPPLKEYSNNNNSSKTFIKEPTESFGKLKLIENSVKELTTIEKNNDVKNIEKYEADVNSGTPDLTQQLPDDIEDIDAGDDNSPLLMSIYIKDIYRYLIGLEKKYSIEPDFLKNQNVITGRMRATLIDWLVEVQRQFSLLLETFQLTVGIVDRYLQAVPNIQRSQLQLVGVTAMFIASKYEEVYAPDVTDFVYVTDNAYTKADVFRCERDILSKLGFCLARPIQLSFLRRFVKAAHGTSKNHHLAKYFVDLCLVEYSMAHCRPSELSAAAMCLSLYLLSDQKLEDIWTRTLTYYSGYTLQRIQPLISKIAKIVVNVENSKFKAVYKKYSDPSLAKVSCLPQLNGESIHELAELSDFDQ